MNVKNKKHPQILRSTVASQSKLFKVEGLELRFANGEKRYYERIVGPMHGSVMIVPILDSETLLLIREYAAGVEEYVLGFPKGAVDAGEDLLATANRELMEETGYGANNLFRLTKFSASPGYFDSVMEVIVASNLYEKRIPGDEPEPIEVVPWKLHNIEALLRHPEFYEARSVAALLLTMRQWQAYVS